MLKFFHCQVNYLVFIWIFTSTTYKNTTCGNVVQKTNSMKILKPFLEPTKDGLKANQTEKKTLKKYAKCSIC